MARIGYSVIDVAPEGFSDVNLPTIDSLDDKEIEINNIAYIGVAISYPGTHTQSKGKVKPGLQTEKISPDGNISYTTAMCKDNTSVGDSESSYFSLNSSIVWESPPCLSPVRHDPTGNDMNINLSENTMPVLSPELEGYPNNGDKSEWLDSDSIETDETSFATALSETFRTDRYESVLDIYHSAMLEDIGDLIDSEIDEELNEALETPFNDMNTKIADPEPMAENDLIESENTDADWLVSENYDLTMKLRKMNDLNNQKNCTEKHKAGKQKAYSPSAVLSNILVTETEQNSDRNKIKNDSYGMDKDGVGSLCKRETKSNAMVLDMRKYIIDKENIIDMNYQRMNWDVGSSGCSTCSRNSQTNLITTSPEADPYHPLESFFKKRHGMSSKAKRNITSLFLCGCFVSKTKSRTKHHKTTKHKKKTSDKLTIGFSWKL